MQKRFNLKLIADGDDSTTIAGCWNNARRSYNEDDIFAATGYIDQLHLLGDIDKKTAADIKSQMWKRTFGTDWYWND